MNNVNLLQNLVNVEGNPISDIKEILELPTTEIIKRLNPEVLRKVIDIVEYAKNNLIGAKVYDLSLYKKIGEDIEKKISFVRWLDNAIEEFKEYQTLSEIGGEELESWLGTPGNSKIPQIEGDQDFSDIFRATLINSLKRIYEDGHKTSYTDSYPLADNINQCTWWSIKTRSERIAYIAWLKEIFETEQAYEKAASERIAELNRKSEEERIRDQRAQSARAYFARLQRGEI